MMLRAREITRRSKGKTIRRCFDLYNAENDKKKRKKNNKRRIALKP